MTVKVENDGSVRIITFNHRSTSNPFSRDMQLTVTEAARAAGRDPSVRAVVFTGGSGRFFSAGGDFNEVREIKDGAAVDLWIDTFMEMYLTLLHVPKPTLAAIDHYAIGIGFQVALMLDWRMMARRAKIGMPELRHGIGGSVGGAILAALYGVGAARDTMLGALEFEADEAARRHFVQEVVADDRLMAETMARAHDRTTFPDVAYLNSKNAINESLDRALRESIGTSKKVHRAAFESRAMASHFDTVLDRGKSQSA